MAVGPQHVRQGTDQLAFLAQERALVGLVPLGGVDHGDLDLAAVAQAQRLDLAPGGFAVAGSGPDAVVPAHAALGDVGILPGGGEQRGHGRHDQVEVGRGVLEQTGGVVQRRELLHALLEAVLEGIGHGG